MICPNCGYNAKKEDLYCFYCGNALTTEPKTTKKPHPLNKKTFIFIYASIILLVIALFVFAILNSPVISSALDAGNWIYYINNNDENRIYKIRLNGTGETKICNDSCEDLLLFKDYLYYTTKSQELYRINIYGGTPQQICNDKTRYFDISDDWIYYTNLSDSHGWVADTGHTYTYGTPYKIKTDGSTRTKINDDMAIMLKEYNGNIYYKNRSDNDNLYRDSINGHMRIELAYNNIGDIAFDENTVFYSDFNDGNTYSIEIDGANKKMISNDNCFRFFITDNWIYYSIFSFTEPSMICRAKKDGTAKEILCEKDVSAFVISDEVIYFCAKNDNGDYELLKMTTAGTQLTKVADIYTASLVMLSDSNSK